jgi:hypothetical protein|tara:strand:- start:293 stop:523 length:231 start_codon:yes stop_codon:yes gene_type:complete
MSGKRVNAILARPPMEYEANYFNQLVREVQQLIGDVRNPIVSAPDLPTEASISILEVGRLYQQDGVVKVVRAEDKE